MKTATRIGVVCLALGLLPTGGALAQPVAPRADINPEADIVLRATSEALKDIEAARFVLVDSIDEVQADGRKLQFEHSRTVVMSRPSHLTVEVSGDGGNHSIWKDGKTLTLLHKDDKVYAELPDPGTIEEAIDMLQEKYGMGLPAADLLCEDLYGIMVANASTVDYVGESSVAGQPCHHLFFAGDLIDWQLWVTREEAPQPRKLVITYKDQPGEPQYILHVQKMEVLPSLQASAFTPQIPEGTEKVPFHPLEMVN